MDISNRFVPMALLLVVSLPARADVPSSGTRVMGNVEAQHLIRGVPGFESQDLWFASGLELSNSPDCVTERYITAYTKPIPGPLGVWHGAKYVFAGGKAPSESHKDCNNFTLHAEFQAPTASFFNPDDLHPDERNHGAIPGIFQVGRPLSDGNLLTIKSALEQIQTCLQKDPSCSFRNELQYLDVPPDSYLPAIRPERLITAEFGYKGTCYNVMLEEESPSTTDFMMTLCQVHGIVTTVHIDVIEITNPGDGK
jgi:hypothetical protein